MWSVNVNAMPPSVDASIPTLQASRAEPLVLPLEALDRAALPLAGGKAANLGELLRAGQPVPPGFCVTTAAYRAAAQAAGLDGVLASIAPGDAHASGPAPEQLASAARSALLAAPIPTALAAAIRTAYAALGSAGEPPAVAVRSSATAEDLPEASFAGQQDTFLNVVGEAALLDAVRRCWASLWTERAVAYRAANGIDHRAVQLAVVVQRMVPAAVAGVLFTANPLSGRRREAVIDAAPGLGEAVVAGAVNPDHFVVDTLGGRVLSRRTAEGRPACLSDDQVLQLARAGAAVERHFGAPQDIEWAFDSEGRLWLLQARPITTLFPLPASAPSDPAELRVYFSFNVAQGVFGPLTPMGIFALRRLATILGTTLLGFKIDPARGPSAVVEAGERLFLDLTPLLRHQLGRRILLAALGVVEAQSGQVIRELLADPRLLPRPGPSRWRVARQLAAFLLRTRLPVRLAQALMRPSAVHRAWGRAVQRLEITPHEFQGSLNDLLDRAERLLERGPRAVLPVFPGIVGGLAAFALARRIARSLGLDHEALLATRGLPYNPTTEMDLELWALAARLRGAPDAVALLSALPAAELAARYRQNALPPVVQAEIGRFLQRYGFRGVAEIDIGVPRWREDPTHVFAIVANYLRLDDPTLAPEVQFRRAAAQAEAAIARILERARASGPRGWAQAALLRFLFDRTRALAGLREAPKFTLVKALGNSRALLYAVGQTLVEQGRLERADDIFFLDLPEARRAVHGEDFQALIAARRARYQREQRRRRVPRILLSDGTALEGGASPAESAGAAANGLAGTPASPGVYRGRARVILDPRDAHLEPGEILVAPSTDPGWTPLFLTAGALVMEMGGMMSHGAVVAREYGIPAVVGAVGATARIQTGQWITVDGTRGVVTFDAAE